MTIQVYSNEVLQLHYSMVLVGADLLELSLQLDGLNWNDEHQI